MRSLEGSGSALPSRVLSSPTHGILIFDEATSALDYESEAIIQQNMAQICKGVRSSSLPTGSAP